MKTLLQHGLIVKQSLIHGYGVFADKIFDQNTIIEECCAIICSGKDKSLENYFFKSGKTCFIATGYGLVYNHADIPNAYCYFDETRHLLIFKSLRRIHPGEEITICYSKTWFSERNLSVKKMPKWHRLLRFSINIPLRTLFIVAGLLLASQWLHVLAAK
ncbi:MAG: hypothetical protein K0S27_658 [Gammaproteobacteria bacterium]|jgi:SET domain-containing protein|nr:hypothetical protein [Gammaproteobacteria bacterium]